MATKLYFTADLVDVSSTPATRGAWDSDQSVIVPLRTYQAGPRLSKAGTENVSTSNYDVLLMKGVSAPIASGITITGNLDYGVSCAESSTSANSNTHIHVWVMAPDGSNRGTLLTDNIYASEWAVGTGTDSGAGRSPAAQAMSSVAAQAGDRIVVEIGTRNSNTSTSDFTMTMSYGGQGLSDITDTGSAANAAWVDLGTDISYDEAFDWPLYRGHSSFSGGSFTKPSGLALGDSMYAVFAQLGNSTITPPSGWTQVFNQAGGGAVATFYKVADSGDVGGSSFAFTTSGNVVGYLVAFYDSDPTDPTAAESSNTRNDAGRDMTTTGITPQANSVILLTHARYKGGGDDPGEEASWSLTTDSPTFMSLPALMTGAFPNPSAMVDIAWALRPQATATGTISSSWGTSIGDSLKGMAALAIVKVNDSAFTPRVIFM